jgi:DUF971 family protein
LVSEGKVLPDGNLDSTFIALMARAFDRAAFKTRFKEEGRMEVEFSDGITHSLPAEYLRVESPSAEVQGHGPSQKKIVSGRRHVKIAAIEPVGHYAIRIVFDDRHDSGIYSWSYLRELGDSYAEKWAAYQAALLYRGLSRDP